MKPGRKKRAKNTRVEVLTAKELAARLGAYAEACFAGDRDRVNELAGTFRIKKSAT